MRVVSHHGESFKDMIIENQPLVNRFISTPKDFAGLNCAAYVAGIVQGILDAADLVSLIYHQPFISYDELLVNSPLIYKTTEKVTAYLVTADNKTRTVIVIKFKPEVMERERRM